MIQVFRNDILVSIINFGWESRDFYQKWMGCPNDHTIDPPMHGASIDISSPNIVPSEGILAFFNALLDEEWIEKFRTHYADVKQKLAKMQGNEHN